MKKVFIINLIKHIGPLLLMKISSLQTVTNILVIVFFFMWFRRAYGNIHRLNIGAVHYGEVHAIWSFIIPILNLFRPYQIAKEIFIKTQQSIKLHKASYTIKTNYIFIVVWWIIYLINGFISRMVLRRSLKTTTYEDYKQLNELYLFSDSVDCIAILFAVLLVYTIRNIENELYQTYNSVKAIDTIGQPERDDTEKS